jgi:hypothetical protein
MFYSASKGDKIYKTEGMVTTTFIMIFLQWWAGLGGVGDEIMLIRRRLVDSM